MLTGILRIVDARLPTPAATGFTIFDGWLAAAVGMNMEAVLAGRQRFQVWRKLQTFRGFS